MTDICVFRTLPDDPVLESRDLDVDSTTANETAITPRNRHKTLVSRQKASLGQDVTGVQPHHVMPMTLDQVYVVGDEADLMITRLR